MTNSELFHAAYRQAIEKTQYCTPGELRYMENAMFGFSGSHRRRYDPEANAWRKLFREKLGV